MCGDDPAPHTDLIGPMYAISAPPRARYDPLAAKADSAIKGMYGVKDAYVASHDDVAPHRDLVKQDAIDGLLPRFMQETYRGRRDSIMMYRNEDTDILTHAYQRAARETSNYLTIWQEMKYNAGAN